jgi:hypothetical protein
LEDLSQVWLFYKHNHFWVYIGKADAVDMPQPYGPQAEFNKIAKAKQRIKELERRRREALEQAVAASDADETELLMGRLSRKQAREAAETVLLASGDDVAPSPSGAVEEAALDTAKITRKKY